MKSKIIDLELAYELLAEPPPSDQKDKKTANVEKKRLRELRERHPISIEVKFVETSW